MKENEYFDNTLFMKLVCILAAVALICVLVFVLVGAIGGSNQEDPAESNRYEEWTFAPASGLDEPVTTAAPATTAEPNATAAPDTTAAPGTTADPGATAAPGTTEAPATTEAPSALTPLPESSAILGETPDAGQAYQDSIVFLGDSTTYGMIPYAVLTDGKQTKQVWTPSSGILT